MQTHETTQGVAHIVRPIGPISGDDADQLAQKCHASPSLRLGRLALDLSAAPFIDSRGLELLLDLSEQVAQSGRTLKLCGLSPTVREILELTDLLPRFECFDDPNAIARSYL
ncbi:MAG: STAS domain-containing protein [Phycisphaera sp.]|nr:STAS domain-containing protein [Phycisphaera sp.]